ncbi:pirin family protein [Pseudomonas sp.]|uniref:pirin family protein n=1 Tax=Pseudomonas sp. TaxID=306 RepID=UPI0028ACEBA6|nr:pirin family protein [Pseudomonas sp.]
MYRNVLELHTGQPAADGAGVRMTRVFAGQGVERFDPFLMLDQFDTANADDYIGGFPAHPHRGFETVTYMLEGRMRHEDHLGNQGLLKPGGLQWMTAARGIIHSEMPEQQEGLMRGFQLWLNLPGKTKMGPASYRDYEPAEVPRLTTSQGVEVVVLAGHFDDGEHQQLGAVQRPDTDPYYFDFIMPAQSAISPRLPKGHRALLYVYEGQIEVESDTVASVTTNRLARLSDEGQLRIRSAQGARVLLIAGAPLNEPIVQYGPFVMNTREQIEQALRDYQRGEFGQ